MKRYGASGKGMQFSSAKRGSQQKAPYPDAHDNPPGSPPRRSLAGFTHGAAYNSPAIEIHDKPVRERQRNAGGGATTIHATYGRGDNDGSKASPRKKVW